MTTQPPPGYRATTIQLKAGALASLLARQYGTTRLPTAAQLAAMVTRHEHAMAQARFDLRHVPAPKSEAERKRLLLARLDRATKGLLPQSTRTSKGKK